MRVDGPGQVIQLMLDLADVLEKFKVPYTVVGGLAVSFHGIERATKDADATVWLSPSSLTREDLARELRSAGYQVENRTGAPDDPIAAVLRLHDNFGNQGDLLMGVRGMSFDAPSRAVVSHLLDRDIPIMGAEDLIAMKIYSGGHQDMEDVRGIFEVSGKKLDLPLLKKLTRRYGVEEVRKLALLLDKHPPK
jgi:hypothetical protein